MKYPTLNEEKKLWKRGYKVVACIDEVGRGPLAGPVVACAVCVDPQILNTKYKIQKLRDSKQLSAKQREYWYNIFSFHPTVQWGIGSVSPQVIDQINIYQATKLAMKRALMNLNHKIDFVMLDGNMSIDVPIPQESIIKGDEKVFSCAIASIIAKVRRDRMMVKYHRKYPHFRFDKHKGYGTRLHFQELQEHGPCKIHRKSFAPCNL